MREQGIDSTGSLVSVTIALLQAELGGICSPVVFSQVGVRMTETLLKT